METENQKRIRVVLENAKEQLKLIDINVRHDLLAIAKAFSQVSEQTELDYFKELREATDFRIMILREQQNPTQKAKKRGRPRKVKVVIKEKRGRGRPRKVR